MYPVDVITNFDNFLEKKGLKFEAVIIGGSALSILGVVTRETKDVDVLDPEIPEIILSASKEFASTFQIEETSLKENWLNSGPESLRKYLRPRWQARLIPLFNGKAISFQTLGRIDFIGTKVLAYCDREFDLKDCIAMKPTRQELLEIIPWVQSYDTNKSWPEYVEQKMKYLARVLGYEL
jgi:hypothetical protein